jgi:hypothetical protein
MRKITWEESTQAFGIGLSREERGSKSGKPGLGSGVLEMGWTGLSPFTLPDTPPTGGLISTIKFYFSFNCATTCCQRLLLGGFGHQPLNRQKGPRDFIWRCNPNPTSAFLFLSPVQLEEEQTNRGVRSNWVSQFFWRGLWNLEQVGRWNDRNTLNCRSGEVDLRSRHSALWEVGALRSGREPPKCRQLEKYPCYDFWLTTNEARMIDNGICIHSPFRARHHCHISQ